MSIEQSLAEFCRPEIAHRAEVMLGGVALAGGLVVALRAFARRPFTKDILVPAAESGFAYLVRGVATRSLVRQYQSRTQIGVLAGVVAVAQAMRPGRARKLQTAAWLVGSVAVGAGVAMAKWALEPDAMSGNRVGDP